MMYVKEYTAYIFLQEFSGFTVKFLIHFEFIFVYGVRKLVSFFYM